MSGKSLCVAVACMLFATVTLAPPRAEAAAPKICIISAAAVAVEPLQLPLKYALTEGWDGEDKPSLHHFTRGSQALPAFRSGECEFLIWVIGAFQPGDDPVALMALYFLPWHFIERPSSEPKKERLRPWDLAGRTMVVPICDPTWGSGKPGQFFQGILMYWSSGTGLRVECSKTPDNKTLGLIWGLEPALRIQELCAGNIDLTVAGVGTPISCGEGKPPLRAYPPESARFTSPYTLYTKKGFLEKHPEMVERLVAALRGAMEKFRNPEFAKARIKPLMPKLQGSLEDIHRAFEDGVVFGGRIPENELRILLQIYAGDRADLIDLHDTLVLK